MNAEILTTVILALVVTAAVLLYKLWWLWRKRRQLWEQVAVELGLSLTVNDTQMPERHGELRFFRLGRNRRARLVLRGERPEGEVCLADYQYTTGSGKSTHTTSQTICLVRASGVSYPHFLLRRQRPVLDALVEAFGGQDIDFADDEAFSKAFVLRGEDETAVRGFLDFETRQQLLPLAERRVQLEARGGTLLVHSGRLIDPTGARDFLQQALDVTEALRRRLAGW